jgi:hypothetical protein
MEVRVKRTLLLLVIGLLLASTDGLALEITSVAPSRAAPVTLVVLSGGPFSSQSRIFLGEQLVPASRVEPGRLEFVVPEIPAGSYSLTVQDDAAIAMQPFLFEVLALPPQIASVVPDNLDTCADVVERLVHIEGRNFLPGAVVLLNGKSVASRFIDSGNLEFYFSELPAGVYGVEVRNPDGSASLPQSLWVNSIPEITSIERDKGFVNHYDIIIRGKNFFYNSILVVREPETLIGRPFRLLAFHATRGGAASSGDNLAARFDQLEYRDCRMLVYQRYPLDMQDKELVFQVINPDGKKTGPYSVTLP